LPGVFHDNTSFSKTLGRNLEGFAFLQLLLDAIDLANIIALAYRLRLLLLSFKMRCFAFAALFPAVALAHIAAWDPSCYGFDADKSGYEQVTPLSELPFNKWWFHGYIDRKPTGPPKEIKAGGSVTLELACRKKFTSFGGGSGSGDPCPIDIESLHAGHPIEKKQILGCGLAIAYKSNAKDVKPADFTVFSIQEDCVKQINTNFAVPAGMPECPDGKCICAWFWQGQDSQNEMYMTGFDCKVTNGSPNARIASPKVAKYCGEDSAQCVQGAKQPLYWANDKENVEVPTDYWKKPSYNSKWGFKNGAQTDIFAAGGEQPKPTSITPTKTSTLVGTSTPAKTTDVPVKAPSDTTTKIPTKTSDKPKSTEHSSSSSTSTVVTEPPLVTTPPTQPTCKSPTVITVTVTETIVQKNGENQASPTTTKPVSVVDSSPSASPASPTCIWKGHCEGARCRKDTDCDQELPCTNRRCGFGGQKGGRGRG